MVSSVASARGVSPYLPLNMSPDVERQIERVLILAGKPVMRRPIAAATVLDALPLACERDPIACKQVRRYLDGYMQKWGATTLQVQGTVVTGDSSAVMPNARGERVDSPWRAAARAYWQPSDYFIVNAGGLAYDGEATPTGSYLSLGFDWAQLDIGWRDHWLGPLSDSSSLISTEAPTLPSVTLSNYDPISPLGLGYEVFFAELSQQDGIEYANTTTNGRPRIAGMQVVAEPVVGYAVSVNRLTQYGGGARNEGLVSQFIDVLFNRSNDPNVLGTPAETGNRVASLASSILFPGRVPFAVRAEYAGEDNTFEGPYRLGETNFTLGIDLPVLWENFDASMEVSEWQNVWYVHHLYPRGLTHEGHALGHWFGDQREFGDAIGGRSAMLRAGWRVPRGDYAQISYRTLDLDEAWRFGAPARGYDSMHVLEAVYSTSWNGFPIDASVQIGRDVFGDSFGRIGASFDFARSGAFARGGVTDTQGSSDIELFVDAGVQYSRAKEYTFLENLWTDTTSLEPGYHVGIGARRRVSTRNDLGVRIELDQVNEHNLMSFRALDWRFRMTERFAFSGAFGVGRYDLDLAAYGYYFNAGLQYRDLLPGWDLTVDYRVYDKISRDKGLASDPESNPGMPRRAIDITGYGLYLSKRW